MSVETNKTKAIATKSKTAVLQAIEDVVYGSVSFQSFLGQDRARLTRSRRPGSSANTSNTLSTPSKSVSKANPTTSLSGTPVRSTVSANQSNQMAFSVYIAVSAHR